MLTLASERTDHTLSRVVGYCAPVSRSWFPQSFRRVYLPGSIYAGCDLFYYFVMAGAVVVPHRLNEPPLVQYPFPLPVTIAHSLLYLPHLSIAPHNLSCSIYICLAAGSDEHAVCPRLFYPFLICCHEAFPFRHRSFCWRFLVLDHMSFVPSSTLTPVLMT